jgi:hypothetical protein
VREITDLSMSSIHQPQAIASVPPPATLTTSPVSASSLALGPYLGDHQSSSEHDGTAASSDADSTVSSSRHQLIVAGGVGLGLGLFIGWLFGWWKRHSNPSTALVAVNQAASDIGSDLSKKAAAAISATPFLSGAGSSATSSAASAALPAAAVSVLPALPPLPPYVDSRTHAFRNSGLTRTL